MKKSKPLAIVLCGILLVATTIIGTVAYLADTAQVVNTFTMGKVDLKLDEAVVDTDGKKDGDERTETGNAYHLIPGMTYTKDPTVTVLKESEESYVRMILTINCSKELDEIFAPNGADLLTIFNGYDATNWILHNISKNTDNNTRTYEFRYKETVKPEGADVVLDALFDSMTVPADLTNAQMKKIADLEITVEAHAIQAVGFADAEAAWTAFSK